MKRWAALALVAVGCVRANAPAPVAPGAGQTCQFGPAHAGNVLGEPALNELSGLAVSGMALGPCPKGTTLNSVECLP